MQSNAQRRSDPRWRGWVARSLCLLCILLVACDLQAARPLDAAEDEQLLKAVFIYNFAKFTHWPEGTWATAEAPLILCIAGSDELAVALGRLAGEPIAGRSLAVRDYPADGTGEGCNQLYVAASEHKDFVGLLQRAAAHPVLTISQIRGFADRGGMIQLYHDQNRIRFKINLAAVRSSGLDLGARLLDLAEVVGNGVAR